MLTDYELINITGGALKALTIVFMGIGALVALVTGIFDGYYNPIKCRK